jgi:hypothetical protein
MLPATKSRLIGHLVTVAVVAANAVGPAWTEDADSTRSVTIIEAPTPAPAPATPAAPIMQPAAPAIVLPGGRVEPNLPTQSNQAAFAPPAETVPLGELPKGVKVDNSAELALEILPGPEIPLGTKVTFRISTKKPGYLLLVDIDAAGKLTQIYPNTMSLMSAGHARENSNRIRPGSPVVIPNPNDVFAGFEFVASPPQGTALICALLSDRPVQMIDLEDVPTNLVGHAAALAYLSNMVHELRIPTEVEGRLQEARWSLNAKFYAIR